MIKKKEQGARQKCYSRKKKKATAFNPGLRNQALQRQQQARTRQVRERLDRDGSRWRSRLRRRNRSPDRSRNQCFRHQSSHVNTCYFHQDLYPLTLHISGTVRTHSSLNAHALASLKITVGCMCAYLSVHFHCACSLHTGTLAHTCIGLLGPRLTSD